MRQRLDAAFSWFVRLHHADDSGMLRCYTCNKPYHWTKVDNGHFISRRYYATRWTVMNCRPQCKSCNLYHSGEQWLFGKLIDEQHGHGTADRLYKRATTDENKEPTADEKKALIEYYEGKVAAILARRIKTDPGIAGKVPKKMMQRVRR